jgi:hypothetical protein
MPTPGAERNKDLLFASNQLTILPTVKLNDQPFFSKKPIVFLHQSKTAGTNVDYLIKAIASFRQGELIEERARVPSKEGVSPNLFVEGSLGGLNTIYNEPERFDCASREINFISGHMPLPTLQHEEEYFKTHVSYITLVRDPIDRELSLANYVYQRKYIEQDEAEDFILVKAIDNLQTRFLAGEEYMVGECNEDTFAKAKENILNRLTLTAPTEDVEILMSILSANFEVENVAYAKGQISGMKVVTRENTELCEKIADKNKFDVMLYDFVKENWENWKAANIKSISYNEDPSKEYLVLSPLFYQTKVPEVMELSQIKNYGTDQYELVIINQNMNSNNIVDPTLVIKQTLSEIIWDKHINYNHLYIKDLQLKNVQSIIDITEKYAELITDYNPQSTMNMISDRALKIELACQDLSLSCGTIDVETSGEIKEFSYEPND